jgi:hypothetical protein
MTSGHYCDGCAQAYYKCVCDKQEEKNIPKRMNERIDKLLGEAGAYFGGDGVVYDTFDPKKFAELLIQQCCNAIVNDSRLSDVRTARNGCVRAIKEHFGVEE